MKNIGNGFGVLGLIFLLMGIYITIAAFSSSDWKQIQGTLIKSEIRNDTSVSRNTGQDFQKQYKINVVYQYFVDGIAYQKTRFSIGQGDTIESGFKQKADAREWLSQSDYTKDNTIVVYVNPNDHEDTVLKPGFDFTNLIPIIMGLVCIGLGFLLRLVARKEIEIAEASAVN